MIFKPIGLDYYSEQHSVQFTEEFHIEAFRHYSTLINLKYTISNTHEVIYCLLMAKGQWCTSVKTSEAILTKLAYFKVIFTGPNPL